MDRRKFTQYNEEWQEAATMLMIAHNSFRNIKHSLEIAKANAWADGQVTGSNNDQRKAALYIIVQPFVESLIAAEEEVMRCQVDERYLRNIIEFAIWNGIETPQAFGGIRERIDPHNPN